MEHTLVYSLIALAILVIGLLVWIIIINQRLNRLTKGKDAQSLEAIISQNNKRIDQIIHNREKDVQDISVLKEKIKNTMQHVGIVRFNPFKETGGNQSFAIALTNEHKDGVIISSLYTRERVNVFAKPVHAGSSSFKLTAEEEQALLEAHQKVTS